MKRTNPKLPPFAGRCHVQLLPATAAQSAQTAQYLARWRNLNPDAQRAGIETACARMLASMLLLLLLWCLSTCQCRPVPAPAPAKPTTDSARIYSNEHPAPHYGRYEWHHGDPDESKKADRGSPLGPLNNPIWASPKSSYRQRYGNYRKNRKDYHPHVETSH